ncbi:MAG: aldose epimerase family protein [Halanaerobium sp.]
MAAIEISSKKFGELEDGREVFLYEMKNKNAVRVDITNYGGIILRLFVPDRNGDLDDIVLGYDNLDQYIVDENYFGALIGRYANRIANAQFKIDGNEYNLNINEKTSGKVCCLHGGDKGFDSVLWESTITNLNGSKALKLTYASKDGESGFPGNLEAEVYYLLTQDNKLKIEYRAITDAETVINLSNHSYFNLKGHSKGNVLDHLININADYFTPVNRAMIPTGEIREVKDTPFDFRAIKELAKAINEENEQLKLTGGFDHNYVLNKGEDDLNLAARVIETISGRKMEVYTTEPGLQFYTGNLIKTVGPAKEAANYQQRSGFCLETQHYPDSPNQKNFPSVILKPGEEFRSTTEFCFKLM